MADLPDICEVIEGNEMTERRDRLKEITQETVESQIQGWQPSLPHLARVNEAARKHRGLKFTNLLHHIDIAALERAFRRQRASASAGIDGVTVKAYRQDLESNLQALHARIQSGNYWPRPVRRTYIPKSDGGKRPLGIPALEDKIVQSAVAELLSAIYEVDFVDFSWGFRPKRGAHVALEQLSWGIKASKTNWILDVDVSKYYDTVDHGWLMRMVAHRIADRRILLLIERWLKAGVMESGKWQVGEIGTPQGSGISPLLSNIFLHYIFDLWFKQRQRRAGSQMMAIRYADDAVMGFQNEGEARRTLADLKERLGRFGLSLNEDKTRLIRFGRFAASDNWKDGLGRPQTFNFLGFTHYCGTLRNGTFTVKCKTITKRLIGKLQALRVEMKRRLHIPVREQQIWLSQVLRGHYGYFGVVGNHRSMEAFFKEVKLIWFKALRRRRQKAKMTWDRFLGVLTMFPLPKPADRQQWSHATR